jgi:uncharacterized membrane protein YphA (DoxX/SURF4 family)
MIQIFFILSDFVFFVVRLALGFFFLSDVRKKIREKNFKKQTILFRVLLILECVASVLLIFGAFTQITSLILILYFILVRSMRIPCAFLEYEFTTFFATLLLLVLLTVGGGVLSVDNFFQIVIY